MLSLRLGVWHVLCNFSIDPNRGVWYLGVVIVPPVIGKAKNCPCASGGFMKWVFQKVRAWLGRFSVNEG